MKTADFRQKTPSKSFLYFITSKKEFSMTTRKTIVTALLILITLSVPLSLYSQSQDFQMKGTVLVVYRGNAANVTIPEGVTSIGEAAFSGSSLTSITIPSSVTSIGSGAFAGCTSLTSVTIPSSVTSIGNNAFINCTSLTSVTIQSGVTSIGNNAFLNCTSLTSITIPSSVTSIGQMAFASCRSLTSVTVSRRTAIGSYAFPSTARITYSD